MAVLNVHSRNFGADAAVAGALIDGLAGPRDQLWPSGQWPRMRFDRPLAVGAAGGHGPIRYTVCDYVPGRWVRFRFTAPRGFHGFHEYTVTGAGTGVTLKHTLAMRLTGPARLSWPLVYRPLHDALIEDSLDRASLTVTGQPARVRWTRYVRLLRHLVS